MRIWYFIPVVFQNGNGSRFDMSIFKKERKCRMKKLLVGALAACMVMNGAVAFAEETEAGGSELNWEDIVAINDAADEDILGQGDFVCFDEIDLMMWVPDAMPETELTDEDVENGYIGYFEAEDQSAAASVMYVDVDGLDLEGYKEALETTDGVEEVDYIKVNGAPALSYDLPDDDTTCLAFTTEAGYVLEFAFKPMSDEDYQAVIMFMAASIQPEDTSLETEA